MGFGRAAFLLIKNRSLSSVSRLRENVLVWKLLMLKLLFFFILSLFLFAELPANAETVPLRVTPANFQEVKKAFPSGENSVIQAEGAVLPDWENLKESDYPKIWNQLTDDFRANFSMKRGYPLGERELALLFVPDSVLAKGEWTEEFETKRKKIQKDIDQTLHELHYERFLVPLRNWCSEQKISLEFFVFAPETYPLLFVFENILLIRRTACQDHELSKFLAASGARQCGAIHYRCENDSLPAGELQRHSVLLLPRNEVCGTLSDFPEAQDVLTESQLVYASVILEENNAILGLGPVRWHELILSDETAEYQQETRDFIQRFQKLGGKITQPPPKTGR